MGINNVHQAYCKFCAFVKKKEKFSLWKLIKFWGFFDFILMVAF
jgi:hypothetical protein